MAGVTQAVLDRAEAWLTEHGHPMKGIAHPEGETARFMAAVALELNVFTSSSSEAVALIVECLAYVHSGGEVGQVD